MGILGRRLYAAFERKAGKIEFINPGPNSTEELVAAMAEAEDDDVINAETRVLLAGICEGMAALPGQAGVRRERETSPAHAYARGAMAV